jgi:glycosyltransferase involved in cell wall biosynthesis
VYRGKKIAVLIPALNEAESLPAVLKGIPPFVDRVIVCDNGSTDNTFEIASSSNHHPNILAVREARRGYGSACLKAMSALSDEDIVVFLDGDGSDHAELMGKLLDLVVDGADLVISNRFTPRLHPQAMSLPQVFGNKLAVVLVRLLWGYGYHDLGPFRAITRSGLGRLNMCDTTFAWTIEMQLKGLDAGLRIAQVDLPYRARVGGRSKISGTVGGVMRAGWKIISTILIHRMALTARDRQ